MFWWLFFRILTRRHEGGGGRASSEKPKGLSLKWTFSHDPVSGELFKSLGFGV